MDQRAKAMGQYEIQNFALFFLLIPSFSDEKTGIKQCCGAASFLCGSGSG
jgi:hypothetical protein